jgi:hypothetical protein
MGPKRFVLSVDDDTEFRSLSWLPHYSLDFDVGFAMGKQTGNIHKFI